MRQTETDSFTRSNIIQLLRIFTPEEMKEFHKFIRSPFHNNRSDVVQYFEIIRKYYPDFDHKDLTKKNIYSKLFPSADYRDDVMRRLGSNLYKLGEEYAAYKNFRKDNFAYEKSILDYYLSRNADKFFLRQYENINLQLDQQKLRDQEYFYRQSSLDELYRTYMMKYDPNYKKVSFGSQIELQWKYILSSMLRLYGFAEYEKYFHNKEYEVRYKSELLRIAEESGFMGSKTIEIYYLLLKLYDGSNDHNQNSEHAFKRLEVMIDKHSDNFDKSECFQFYIHLFNYLNIKKLNSGSDFSIEEFGIAKKMTENELLVQNGSIDPGWFRGIFSKAFNAGEIKFAEEFIEKYKYIVAGDEKESVVNHVYAHLEIYKKNYDAALKYLEKSAYMHLNDKWSVKNMYLTIYYEKSEYEQFFYTVDSIKHLIKEAGLWSDNMITPIRNFLNISTKLFRRKLGEQGILLDELRHQTINSNVRARKWLLEKIAELEV